MSEKDNPVQKKDHPLPEQTQALMRAKDFVKTPLGFKDPLKFIHELQTFQSELELRITNLTKELATANRQLQMEIANRKAYEQEKKKLEGQLRQAQKMEALGTLSSGIAHDFNNILTSIIAFTQLLEMQKFPDANYMKNSLKHILQSAYQARDLIKQIMMFSRNTEQIKEPVVLDLVINEVVKMIRATLPSTIDIREQIIGKQCTVFANPVQMHQVFMNLCTNAAHAMSSKGGILNIKLDMVNLSAEQCNSMDDITPGKYAQIIISDTGHGIIPEHLQRIFDPYFTTKKPGEGTGLGLSVTHGIIRNHGGAILVDSCPGQGTTFKLLVPCFLKHSIKTKDTKPCPISPGKAVILFVDDEKAIAMGVQMVLKHLGYKIMVKTSGKNALTAFSQDPEGFDVVITDLTMPEITGDVLASKIKKIRPNIPVILCTGLLEEDSETILSKYEVDAFIRKPYNKQTLIESIQNVIKKINQD